MAGNNVVHPAELERELQARLARAQERRPGRAPTAPASGPRRRTKLASVVVAAALAMIASLAIAAGFAIHNSSVVTIDDAIYRGYNPGSASGTGVFDVFLQVAGGGSVTVKSGYNTDGTKEFQTGSSATHNHSYRLSNVPLIFDPTLNGGTLTREFQLDVNQNDGANLSLDEVEVYLTDCPFITDYPFADWTTPMDPADCDPPPPSTYSLADLVYDLDKNGSGFVAGANHWLELDDDISAGSGKRDMILRIPNQNFLNSPLGDDPECTYVGGPPAGADCNTYVVLYAHFGSDNPALINTDGFEEWGVQLYDLASKSGMKFNDLDADGIKDAGEPGLPNWRIFVDYNGSGAWDPGEPSDLTDANGNYLITGIVAGTYNVREVPQTGWVCSFPNLGTETAPVTSGRCYYPETFAEGDELTGNDFGNWATATKEGRKFNDLNGDGDDEGGTDPGLGGWVINAYRDSDLNGILSNAEYVAGAAGTDTTDAGTGAYSIAGLAPGKYVVCEVQKSDWVQTFPTGADDCTGSASLGQDGHPITLTSGQTDSGNDFGNFQLIDKSGAKYVDDEGDGSILGDSKYTAVGGWTVRLYQDDGSTAGALDATDTLLSTTATTAGDYSFTNLGPGTYIVCEATKTDWVQTFPNTVGGEVIDTCDNVAGNAEFGYLFTASSGTDNTANDFGNFQLIDKSGAKYVDDEGNGSIDGDSKYTAVGGWTVRLYRDNGSTAGALDATDTLLSTTATTAGDYSFTNLGPGTYIVCEATKTDWVQTFPNTVGGEVIDTCDNVAGNAEFGYLFTASSGTDNTANDFGNFQLIDKSGAKYVDDEGNGSILGDSKYTAVGGWTVRLYQDDGSTAGALDATDTLLSTTATTAGDYSFTNLGPGTYIVCEATKTDWVQTFPNTVGGEVIDTCDNVAGNAEFGYLFTASSGTDNTANDFGNFQLIDKSGAKYVDDEGDGSILGDSKYTAVGGWTVRLYQDDGSTAGALDATDTLLSTTATTAGDYSFTNLGPGTYIVCEATKTDWVQTFPNTVGGEVIDTCDNVAGNAEFGYLFTASSGTDNTANDFGNFQLIDKSGFKFNDNDMDGVFEPAPSAQNDTKLTGWTIELWQLVSGTWQWVATDTTDATGYSFANLGPGTYAVCEVIQANWTQSYPVASVPAGETLFDCTTLTPNSGGAFAPHGFQFTASSGTDQSTNNFGNFLVPPGCTLTQGYWKTHSIYGPAAHPDDTWDLITAAMTGGSFGSGPDSEFFDSGQTWIQVFQTSPKGGNAWYILAHQYMAAVLNQLNGAGDVAGLSAALADAYTLLDYYDTQQNIPKNANNVLTSTKDRAEAIAIAGFLASYNEGQLGVPHCGESGFAGVGLSLNIVWPIALAPIAAAIMRRRRRLAA